MRVSELFYSIQGEGILAGIPSFFIRTTGCNLRCAWCDTPYTSWHPEGVDMTLDGILERLDEYPAARHAVVTGGEPLIAPEIADLTQRLRARNLHITIETAGTVDPPGIACDLMSISPKLANSTPEGAFAAQHERLRIQPSVLRSLTARFAYQLKFVVAQPSDLEEIRAVAALVDAPPDRILLMPEGIQASVLRERAAWLASLCKAEGYRYCPRLHIELFGNQRGT